MHLSWKIYFHARKNKFHDEFEKKEMTTMKTNVDISINDISENEKGDAPRRSKRARKEKIFW